MWKEQIFANSKNTNSDPISLADFQSSVNRDGIINGILKNTLEMFNANRAYIFLYYFERQFQRYEYEVCSEGISPQKDIIGDLPLTETDFLNSIMLNKKPFIIDNLEDLKEVAYSEYVILKQQEICSLALVPLIYKNEVLGYMGIDLVNEYRIWTQNDVLLLKSLSEIISMNVELNQQFVKNRILNNHISIDYHTIPKFLTQSYEDSPIGVELYDMSGKLVDVNKKDMEIFGINSKRDILGISLFENPNISDEDKEALRNGIDTDFIIGYNFKNIKGYYPSEFQDKSIYLNCKGHVVKDEKGNISFFQFFIIDVTHLKQMQQELIIAKQKAEESNRLKSAFLANMSHEIRTPLNSIVGFSDLLANIDDMDLLEEYTGLIKKNSELLLQIVNDILDLSRIESGTVDISPECFNLVELLSDICQSVQMGFKQKPITLLQKHHYEQCDVVLDKKHLTQVLINFTTNAFKCTKQGTIKAGFDLTPNGILLFVEDTGIGIPEDKIPVIFKRFEKLNGFIQGTGLGLTICKAIVEAQGGEIGVESKVGVGSRFWVSLPCEVVSKKEVPN